MPDTIEIVSETVITLQINAPSVVLNVVQAVTLEQVNLAVKHVGIKRNIPMAGDFLVTAKSVNTKVSVETENTGCQVTIS